MNRVLPAALILIVSLLVGGCGEDEAPLEPVVPADPYPANSTPEGAIRRFIATYEAMDTTEYFNLFTKDFVFEFSSSTDPDLVNKFSAGWYKDDEVISSRNLFVGGVNSEGQFLVPATTIDLNLDATIPTPVTAREVGAVLHERLFTGLNLTIQLPPSQTDREGTTFAIGGVDPAVHEFLLVRGDAAILDSDQPADSSHWYIDCWRDRSTVASSSTIGTHSEGGRNQIPPLSWGRVKGIYR